MPPEPFDAIHISGAPDQFNGTVVDAPMLGIANIGEAVIAWPAIGVDHALQACLSSDYGLRRDLGRGNFQTDCVAIFHCHD